MITKFKIFEEKLPLWKQKFLEEIKEYKIGQKFDPVEIIEYILNLHDRDDFDDTDFNDRIYSYVYFELEEVDIVDIDADEFEIDTWDVEKYMKMLQENDSYPPIVIGDLSKQGDEFLGEKNYTIIDGAHRLNALKKLGYEKVDAFVGHDYTPYVTEDEFEEDEELSTKEIEFLKKAVKK